MKTSISLFLCLFGIFLSNCADRPTEKKTSVFSNAFLHRTLNDPSDYFYVDFKQEQDLPVSLPIGMFDSGTGGLTVLNALIDFDSFDNTSHELVSNGDGMQDFLTESFIYFGDQANMPYGNYAKMDKSGYLKELVLKDALFLLGNKYYQNPADTHYQTDKQRVKLIVIACNTATAYAKDEIETMIKEAGSSLKVIGVIDAGVRGALATFTGDESGTIAVLATAGTVSSNGYVNSFNNMQRNSGHSGTINLVQQGCPGVAEAIDEEASFIDRRAIKPRQSYKGPSLDNEELKIERELMKIYNFDTHQNRLLCDLPTEDCSVMQLNSPENYMKFYLVSLCEQLRKQPDLKPLKTIILGCTHFPFLSGFIKKTLDELYNLKINGKYIYRNALADSIILIDPAINTAKEVYEYLVSQRLFNQKGDFTKSEFYISEPILPNPDLHTDSPGRFSYDYKYGRSENQGTYDTKQIPMSKKNMPDEIMTRLKSTIPNVYELIRKFNQTSPKTKFLKEEERL